MRTLEASNPWPIRDPELPQALRIPPQRKLKAWVTPRTKQMATTTICRCQAGSENTTRFVAYRRQRIVAKALMIHFWRLARVHQLWVRWQQMRSPSSLAFHCLPPPRTSQHICEPSSAVGEDGASGRPSSEVLRLNVALRHGDLEARFVRRIKSERGEYASHHPREVRRTEL